ncbi:amidohydrolase family protein [Compostimonas suwonensis]|uniref:L-fuconolactonase n=1 Tax=Compostimonas suwonensis TaxID=1048394 RepID=A0A2M9BVP3_9MICO|nr:amidohydrolase family protein [Compostimonas suwonensis]PJJ62011.1 L-fuconolactonase [Compostimonas suwonensis]
MSTGAGVGPVEAPSRVVDAHQHLWDPARRDYAWMDGSTAAINVAFGVRELEAALAPTPVTATIVVQAVPDAAETRELLAVSAGAGPVEGVVGWADLTSPELGDELALLAERPGRLVGIRHQVQAEADPDWLLRDEVVRGLAAVAEAGLAVDLLVDERQWPAALALAEMLPGLPLVLDHLGNPPAGPAGRERWRSWLARLARRQNVSCKVSGLLTQLRDASPDVAASYAVEALEVFGPQRSMFGSDWPVCLLAGDYAGGYGVADAAARGLSPDERAAFLAGTADRVYGLGERR